MSDNSIVHFAGPFNDNSVQESVIQAPVTDQVEENEPEANQNGLSSSKTPIGENEPVAPQNGLLITATIQSINLQTTLNGLPSLDQEQEK